MRANLNTEKNSKKLYVTSKEIKSELWKRGELSWKLKKSQRLIEKNYQNVQGKLFVSNCSRRFGKSFWAAVKCLEVALRKPKSKIKFASAFSTEVEEIIIPAFKFLLEDCPTELEPQWLTSKKKYIFKNESEIQVIGLDRNPNGPRGQFCDLFIFEEAGFISRLDYLYSSVVVPMFKGRKDAKAIMISTPPTSPVHPFRDFCEKAKKENAFSQFTIFDDPEATSEEIEIYKNECLSISDWKREYLVEFTIDANRAIIPEYEKCYEGVLDKDEFYEYYPGVLGMDLGVRDKTVCLYSYYDFNNATLCVLDETVMFGKDLTTDKLAQEIKEKEKRIFPDKKVLRYSDNNNPLLLQDLSSNYRLPFSPTTKSSIESMVNKVRIWMKDGRIRISKNCKELIGCLENGIWRENRKEFDRSKVFGHFDALAALIYLVRNVNESHNPIPKLHKISHNTHWIEPDYEKTQTHKALKSIFKRR
jgi:hypothetical protein